LIIAVWIEQVSGTKFYYLKNEAVLLELALINWTLSQLLLKGFVPLSTPDLVRSTVLEKCGFQPCGQNTQVSSPDSPSNRNPYALILCKLLGLEHSLAYQS
jgi:seryl-tRNA synthetase